TGAVVGTLLSLSLASLGVLISVYASSNRVGLSLSLFLLLALFVPTQLPSSAQKGWLGDLLLRGDPITAGGRYVGKIPRAGGGLGGAGGRGGGQRGRCPAPLAAAALVAGPAAAAPGPLRVSVDRAQV